jgi:mannan endo-1,4-beta-mannosidase
MSSVQINTSSLTHTQFLIPELSSDLIEGAITPTVQLEPGEYTFQMPLLAGLRTSFKFQVTLNGLIDYDLTNDDFLSGRGTTTLTVQGFTMTLDARSLSHDLMFNGGIETIILSRDRTHDLTLIPGTGYGFRATPNTIADFQFVLGVTGQIVLDPQYKEFASTDGLTLTINGYRITIDGQALSHDLRLYLMGNDDILSRSQAHELTLLPTAGYTFWPTIRDLADFRFDLSITGQIGLNPKYAKVATVQLNQLILTGYPITIDGRSLSYDLELDLISNVDTLPHNQTHELTVLPAKGYAFQPTPKIPENFQFEVELSGQIAVSLKYVGFAVASGRSLILKEGRQTFYTIGRYLYDRLGNRVILRGINKMSVWDAGDPDGAISFREIRQTGANTVRIVWAIRTDLQPGASNTDPNRLDTLITNAKQHHLIPMIELHDATGNWSRLPDLVSYWTQPSILSIIQKHQAYLLINIGNEVGDDTVTHAQFITGYTSAIQAIRTAGIHAPLVIDAPEWGKNLAVLDATATALLATDPEQNLLFSVHLYWGIASGADANFIRTHLQQSVALNYPLIVGEFSQFGAFAGAGNSVCSPKGEIDYATILEVCHQHEIGWYAWEWGPGNDFNDPLCVVMDMTRDRRFATLKPGWAEEVAISSPYSIKNTAVTPPTLQG